MDYPAEIATFTVTGKLMYGNPDSEDSGIAPDLEPVRGASIVFEPEMSPAIFDAPVAKMRIYQRAVPASTDYSGNITGVYDSTPDVQLPYYAGQTWRVTIQVPDFPTQVFSITGSPGGIVNIGSVVPVPPDPGTDIIAWEAVVAETTAARDAAIAAQVAAEAAVTTSASQYSFMSPIGDPWDGQAQASAVGAARGRVNALMRPAGTQVALGRRGLDYDLYQELATNVWWQQTLAYDALAGETHHSMYQSIIGIPMLTVDQTDASFVYATPSTGWVTSTQAGTFGGNYNRNDTTGATVTWTTPACTSIGLRQFLASNGGYAKVELDGSATAATLLPTAQDEVTAGRLAATALVAGGGTLNPTDRVYSSYRSSQLLDGLVRFAEGLSNVVHTVKLTVTGYAPTGSTGVRCYISGGIYATTTTTAASSGMTLAPLATLLSSSSVYEYAITYKRSGGTLFPFIGNRHGNELEDTFTFKIDGATVTPADGSVTLGAKVEVNRTSHFTNPDNSAETVANGHTIYTMTPLGLDVHWTIDWLVAGVTSTAYIGMLPSQNNVLDKGRAAAGPVVTLLSDDNSAKGATRSDTVVLWSSTSKAAVAMTCRNLPVAVKRWASATSTFAWLQDRTAGDFNKAYIQRVQAPAQETVDLGDRWESYLTFQAAWMADTSVLAVV